MNEKFEESGTWWFGDDPDFGKDGTFGRLSWYPFLGMARIDVLWTFSPRR